MTVFIFGHKNPDTDSVTSAIATAYLKNHMGLDAEPGVLGSLNKESAFVLDYFNMLAPQVIDNIKTQVKDVDYKKNSGISPETSILYAYREMEKIGFKTLPVVDDNNKLLGLVSMNDIAIEVIRGNFYHLKTSLANIVKSLDGKQVVGNDEEIEGKISVIAYYYDSIKGNLSPDDIIIVGDRYDIIEHGIKSSVKLIIITGGKDLPTQYIAQARAANVAIIIVPSDTYTTSKLINQCNYVSSIMKSKDLTKFNQNEYLEEIKDEMISTNYRNYPVVDDDNIFLGFISRRHLLNPSKKKVILVDHNEYSQSAEGLYDAEILEIIDHHKLGDILTTLPIAFRNLPVGSTCTIVYSLYKEQNLEIPYNIAGMLLSGIISDTLFFKSPTTTSADRDAVKELNTIVGLDLEKFVAAMFKAGTSLEGYTIAEIFHKDFKEFVLDGHRTGLSQVFTLDIEDVMLRKNEFIEFINETHAHKNYYLTLLLITDIMREGSYLLYKASNSSVLSLAFNVTPEQGFFVENLVSRKKQVVPKILDAINMLG